MSQTRRPEDHEDAEAEAADRAFAPAIIGLTYRFADPEVERRYLAAMAPHSQRRLIGLIVVGLLVTASRIGGPSLQLFHDPYLALGVLPRLLQILICGGMLVALRKPRSYPVIEGFSFAFTVGYLVLRCCLLPASTTDGSAALVIGAATLLWFGSPLRLVLQAPLMLAGSLAMWFAWSRAWPPPSSVASFQVLEWLAVVNLLGIFAMRLMRYTLRRQWALSQALRHLATHDGLTGIANRRHYDQMLAREWRRCRREALPLSLVVMDVDFFKLLNDGIGHEAGDDCLREMARLLRQSVSRPGDLVARTGGEEFACLLPGSAAARARDIAERIAAAVRAQRMPHPGSPIGPHITISLGVATAWPGAGATLRDLTALADRLVYEAKNGGRDCIRQGALDSERYGRREEEGSVLF